MLDIETSPIKGYVWGMYEQNVLKVIEQSKIIAVAWKELNDKKVSIRALPDYVGYKPNVLDDKKLCKEVWQVLDEADVVVAHNGDQFDLKKLNTRFADHEFGAPSAYKSIDTRKVAKKHFRFDSNSLNELSIYLFGGHKINNGGFGLWDACMKGDMDAWKRMKDYNVHDVELLEKVYLRLRPFMDNHPNMNIVAGHVHNEHSCPVCLSKHVTRRGYSITRAGKYQRFQCNDCGTWSSGPYEKAKVALR